LKGEIKDPTYYPVIFNYQGDDIYNPENWSKANPSLDVTIKAESVQESADKAKRNKADERNFRQLRLNQWPITKLTTWLDLSLWDSTIGVWNRMDLLGLDCYPGLDLSSTTDLSALALLFPPQGEQLDWRVIFECWIPEDNIETRIREDKIPYDQWAALNWIHLTEGNVIDYTAIEERILELAEIYNFVEFCADMAFAAMLLQRLEHQEINVVSIPQTYLQLTDPMNQTEVLLEGGELTHEDNPVARWCFGNTSIAKNGQGLIKYVKETKGKSVDRTKRIDLVAAWITAMARARFYEGDIDLSAAILSDDWGF
jgi:phage terminase large subunit-like protein